MEKVSCAFTGHRPQKLKWGYNEAAPDCVKLKLLIEQQIEKLVSRGVKRFISGMALGADQWMALAVIKLKKTNPALELICALPCDGQSDRWTKQSKECYFSILDEADEVVYVQHQYTKDCMGQRNRYMIDHAQFLLAVYSGSQSGGTATTVQYAQRKEREVITINPDTLQVCV